MFLNVVVLNCNCPPSNFGLANPGRLWLTSLTEGRAHFRRQNGDFRCLSTRLSVSIRDFADRSVDRVASESGQDYFYVNKCLNEQVMTVCSITGRLVI